MNTDIAPVQRRLQKLFDASLPGKGGRVTDVSLLGAGYECDVFAFTLHPTAAPDSPRHLVLRIYLSPAAGPIARREAAAMVRLKAAGFPVPDVERCDARASNFGGPFLIMERIPGESLGRTYWSGGDAQRHAERLHLKLMTHLHALDPVSILRRGPADPNSARSHTVREIAAIRKLLKLLGDAAPLCLTEAVAWLARGVDSVAPSSPTLIHGDFHPNNVMVRADGALFVIDWSNLKHGDRRMDIAWYRLITQADRLPDGGATGLRVYEQLAGQTVTNIEYFDALACCKVLASHTVTRLLGASVLGLRPDAGDRNSAHGEFTAYTAGLLKKRTGVDTSSLTRLTVL